MADDAVFAAIAREESRRLVFCHPDDAGRVRALLSEHDLDGVLDGLLIVKPAALTQTLLEADAVYMTHQPALRLPDDMARALLDALSAHYGGTSDTRTLRSDMLHERGRVDRMIDALIRGRPA